MVVSMPSRKAHFWWSRDGTDIINVSERAMATMATMAAMGEECGRSRG